MKVAKKNLEKRDIIISQIMKRLKLQPEGSQKPEQNFKQGKGNIDLQFRNGFHTMENIRGQTGNKKNNQLIITLIHMRRDDGLDW